MPSKVISGISPGFPELSQSLGQVTHVLLTRSPLSRVPKDPFALDLHVLSTPPAFVLSQDQTLRENLAHAPEGAVLALERARKLKYRSEPSLRFVLWSVLAGPKAARLSAMKGPRDGVFIEPHAPRRVRQAHWRPPTAVPPKRRRPIGFLILFSFQRPRAT